MKVRKAERADIPSLLRLLYQVHAVHAEGRPDLFKRGCKKYTEEDLEKILANEKTPVLVYDDGGVLGYAFCVLEEIKESPSLVDRKSLYIDDVCVDENERGKHIGKTLYEAVIGLAEEKGCYHVTLNVWDLNAGAMRFYEALGMTPLKVTMEKILK